MYSSAPILFLSRKRLFNKRFRPKSFSFYGSISALSIDGPIQQHLLYEIDDRLNEARARSSESIRRTSRRRCDRPMTCRGELLLVAYIMAGPRGLLAGDKRCFGVGDGGGLWGLLEMAAGF